MRPKTTWTTDDFAAHCALTACSGFQSTPEHPQLKRARSKELCCRTFFLLGFRAFCGVFVCLDGQRRLHQRKVASRSGGPVLSGQEPYNAGHVFYAILTAIMVTGAATVAIGYWAVIRVPDDLNWEDPIKHGANAVVLLIELLISRLPMTTTWLVFPVGYTCLYTIFMILHHKIDGDWVYRRTNVDRCSNVTGYIFAPIFVTIVFFALCAPLSLFELAQRVCVRSCAVTCPGKCVYRVHLQIRELALRMARSLYKSQCRNRTSLHRHPGTG